MRILSYILIVSVCAFIYSCRNSSSALETTGETAKDSVFKWIEGKYIVISEESGLYNEEWIKTDNNNYKGIGLCLTRDCIDTIFSMKMRLIHSKGKTTLFYDVKGQNENKETEFTLTKSENGVYVFENPFRDFPSIMQYKLIGDSVIEVTERGFKNNKEKIIEYRATKIN